ncbi:MAG: pseudouridine synthase [Hyphomonadaceae bacterium]
MAPSPLPPSSPEGERIAKFLARAGVCSRRDAERLIAEGRVKLNGAVLDTPAVKVTGADKVLVDGRPIGAPEATRLWRYHKPSGLVTTHRDPGGRPTVFQHLPGDMPRVISVGRLDLTSEGLLLLTNDGELARKLELPANGWRRRYRARAFGRVTQEDLDQLKDGVTVEGVHYGPIEAKLERGAGSNAWITLTLSEGKNREVRRVLDALGLKVNRLIRVAYGPFQLGTLPPGAVEEVPGRVLREQLAQRRPD